MKLCTCFSARLSSNFRDTTATNRAVQPAPCNFQIAPIISPDQMLKNAWTNIPNSCIDCKFFIPKSEFLHITSIWYVSNVAMNLNVTNTLTQTWFGSFWTQEIGMLNSKWCMSSKIWLLARIKWSKILKIRDKSNEINLSCSACLH